MFRLISYLLHIIRSKGPNRIHSPFVFGLYTEELRSDKLFYVFEQVEEQRRRLERSTEKIPLLQAGAGSLVMKGRQATLGRISKNSLVPPRYGRLLFRLVQRFKPEYTLELGTSLGISTLYLALPDHSNRVITLEGNAALCRIAREQFEKTGVENIRLEEGLFEERLPEVLAGLPRLDFIYLDGDHRKEATLYYINKMLPLCHNDTVLVMDDIYWSRGMAEAWAAVKSLPQVQVTIDLYRMGLVFFRKEQVKQHFVLRF